MANNLFANTPAACVAKQTTSFASAGLDASNINIIYEVGNPLKSWVPDRSINAITGFTADKGYYIVPKIDMDLTTYVAPPLPTGGGGAPAAPTAAVVDDTADTFNWTNNPLFPNVSEYEQTLNGGSIWTALSAKPIAVGDVAKAIGQVGVRVRAIGGNPASAGLFNASAFNVAGGGGYDTEAQAAFTAIEAAEGSALSSGTKDAYNAWVLREKAAARYAKYGFIYPMLGATAGGHSVNAKTPGTKNTVWNGTGWTHTSAGAKSDESAGTYGDTQVKPSDLSQNSNFLMLYTNEWITPGYLLGAGNGTPGSVALGLIGGNVWLRNMCATATPLGLSPGTAIGSHIVTRTISTEYLYIRPSGAVDTISEASDGQETVNIYISDIGGATGNQAPERICFVAFGSAGFSSAEATAAQTSLNTLMSDLGR
jgi:hypothetical protein